MCFLHNAANLQGHPIGRDLLAERTRPVDPAYIEPIAPAAWLADVGQDGPLNIRQGERAIAGDVTKRVSILGRERASFRLAADKAKAQAAEVAAKN